MMIDEETHNLTGECRQFLETDKLQKEKKEKEEREKREMAKK